MTNLSKDILLTGFISGEFIISSTILVSAALASKIKANNSHKKVGPLTWG